MRPVSSCTSARHLPLMADFPRLFLGFCGPDLPYTRFNHRSVISAAQEITDALVSDRRRPRLFPDHSVDRPGTGDRLKALADGDTLTVLDAARTCSKPCPGCDRRN